MKLYLARHPETVGNIEGRFYGRTDLDITKRGCAQMAAFADRYRHLPIQKIYASPLKRAREAALLFSKKAQKPLFLEDRIQEIHFGIFENLTATQIEMAHPIKWQAFMAHPYENYQFEGGESRGQFKKRVDDFLDEAIQTGEDQLWMTHAGVIGEVLVSLLGLPFQSRWQFKMDNCCLITLNVGAQHTVLEGLDNTVGALKDEGHSL